MAVNLVLKFSEHGVISPTVRKEFQNLILMNATNHNNYMYVWFIS